MSRYLLSIRNKCNSVDIAFVIHHSILLHCAGWLVEKSVSKTDGLGLKCILITQGLSRVVEPLMKSSHELVGVLESAPRNYKKKEKPYGIVGLLRWVKGKTIGKNINLKRFCDINSVPYRFLTASDDANLIEWIEDLKLDIIVVFSMSQLLKEKIFSIPRFGTINLHPSMLPEYRGPNPDFWQYYDVELNPGVTLHYVDKGEDTGDIIFQERDHIPLGTKSPERLNRLIGEVGVSLMLKALDAIGKGNAPKVKQPTKSPTSRAKNLKSGDHKSIIDWNNWDGERIWHVLRGTELWLDALPQPKGIYKGQRWTVEEYESCGTELDKLGVIQRAGQRFYVATKDGRIYIKLDFNWKKLIIGLLKK